MAPYFGLTGRKLHAAIWIEALIAISIFGYNGASSGGVLNMPSFEKQFPSIDVTSASASQKHDRSTIQGTVIGVYTLFGVFGALSCTFIGDVLGRRRTIAVAAAINILGVILMSSSYSLTQFIFGRLFIGLGTGAIVATVPVWQSELSRAESRGSHVSSMGIYCGTGLSLALWVAYGLTFTTGQVTWRVTLAGSGVLAVIVMATIFTLPESPRWLKLKDRGADAREVLEILHPGDQELVDKEIEDIDLAIKMSINHAALKDMFKMGPQRIFHRVMLASIVQVMLQFTGVNAIASFAPTIYGTTIGLPAVEAGALAAASQACIILGGIICAYTVERFGRRALMMFSAAGMSVCLASVSGLASTTNPAAGKAAIFFLYAYFVVYTLGYIGLPFLVASEVAPVQLRASVCGLSTAVSWLFNFLVIEITPVGLTDITYRYFIIYAVTCATFVPIVFFFYPETSGRSLEEIDAFFTKSTSIFDTVRVAKEMPKLHLAELGYGEKATDAEHIEKEV